jgi:N-acylglucosamine 2-epimerase
MLERYCEKHFVDAQNGEWYGYLHYDNTPSTTLKGNIFKGPFHIPRLYMIMAVLDEDGCIKRYAQ